MAAPADRLRADVNDPHGAVSLSVHNWNCTCTMQSVESGSPSFNHEDPESQQSRVSLSYCTVEIPAAVAPRLALHGIYCTVYTYRLL